MTRFFKTAFALTAMTAMVVVFGTACIMAVSPDWGLFAIAMIGIAVIAACAIGYNLTDWYSKA